MRKMFLLVSMSVGIIALLTVNAFAFHDGGVAHCNGCHTMHNSEDGALVDPDAPNGNPYLLIDATASDVCLSCHADGSGEVWGDDPLNPPTNHGAGNFCFAEEDNINDGHNGALDPIPGAYGVHNVIAPSMGGTADPVQTVSPGGAYPAASMSCTSCHDPHGNEHFRMLYGISHVEAGDFLFTNVAPTATGLNVHGGGESATNHTAYNSGMSGWCGNCHGDFHNNGTALIHPSGSAMGASIAQTYNLYNGTVDQAGGLAATAYIPEVAFEDAAMTTSSTAGPSGTSQVSCVTCHRAHGSSGPNIGRWDFNVTFLHEDGVESGSYAIPDPYANDNQRSLCNKCHNKDEGDENPF
ncbi:hypothetical protein KKG05_09360 [bacterium]|nr:hypothetical protein [bacterium]